jgi:transposase
MTLSTKQQQRQAICLLWDKGIRSAREIKRRTDIGLSTIYYNLKKLKETGGVAQKKGAGRPKKITSSVTRAISQFIRRTPTISVGKLVRRLEDKGVRVGRETVRRHLCAAGYKNSLPLATPMLTAAHKEKRLEWAREHLNDDWSRTLFSDETSFQLFRNTITQWYKHSRPIRRVPKNRQKIHMWGAFCASGKTNVFCFSETMNAPFYVDILKKQLPEVRKMMGDDWTFQHDNDPKHTSRLAKEFLEENVPAVIGWPSNSPDLNPIENLWGIIKRNVEERKPKNLEELQVFMTEEWDRIPSEVYKNLIDTMPARCQQIIDVEGDRIKY